MTNSLLENIEIRSKYKVRLNYVLDFILPRLCASCKKKLPVNIEIVCKKCFSKLILAKDQTLKYHYQRHFGTDKFIDDFRAAYLFEADKPIQRIIHSLKYDKKFFVGTFLGKMVAKIHYEEILKWNADFIVPVPLHRIKKSLRGYNQSDYIAKGISKELGIPVKNKLIKRKRNTETQTHLTHFERMMNVKEAFKVNNKKLVSGKNLILVDDVVTTGSTISECARTLKNSGAKNVYALFSAVVI